MDKRGLILVLSTLFLIGLIGSVNAGYYVLYNDDTEYPPTTHTYDNPNGYIINVTMEDSRWTSTSTQVCLTFNYVNGSTASGGCNSCLYQTWVERVYTNPNPTWEVESTTSTGGTNVYVRRYNAYAETDETVFSVNLTNITNGQSIATNSTILNASYSMTQENYSYQWKNVTYYIWTNEGLYNTSATITLTGNTTTSSYEKSDYAADKIYYWNVYACYDNTTFGKCQWSNNGNWTFYNYYPNYDNYYLYLNFSMSNGTEINISGYVDDKSKVYPFTNVSYYKLSLLLEQGIVSTYLLTDIYNESAYSTWVNGTQYYEFDNSNPVSIYENITIFDSIDTILYLRTLDIANNIITNAEVRLYAVTPAIIGDDSYDFYGQRLTNTEGKTFFLLDSEQQVYLQITKDGYKAKTITLKASEIESVTYNTALDVHLEKADYTSQLGIFLSGLYELNNSRLTESKWDSLTSDYYMYLYDPEEREIKYSTTFSPLNKTVTLDSITKMGVIELLSGTNFNSASNSTWYLYIWADGEMAYQLEMEYGYVAETVILDIDTLNLRNSTAWKWVIFGLLIGLSLLLGLSFPSNNDVGINVFMTGCIVSTVLADGLIWVGSIGGLFYAGKLIKGWLSQ